MAHIFSGYQIIWKKKMKLINPHYSSLGFLQGKKASTIQSRIRGYNMSYESYYKYKKERNKINTIYTLKTVMVLEENIRDNFITAVYRKRKVDKPVIWAHEIQNLY